MKFGVKFNDKNVGRRYSITMAGHAARHRRALIEATKEARDIALAHSRANISQAGRFGTRWTKGLTGEIKVKSDSIETNYRHAVPYFSVFQFGKVIHGKPLLWIPLSFAKDAQGVRARDFPGGLFRVDRKTGAPLLLSFRTAEPKYFGIESVKIPKKFRVLEIIRLVSSQIKLLFVEQLNKQR